MKIKITDIIIKKRIRKNLGDIDTLADSIKRLGLLNPVILNKTNQLLAGERRLRACIQLGWEEIDVIIINKRITKLKQIDIELEENLNRMEFSAKELEDGFRARNKLRYRENHPTLLSIIIAFFYWVKFLFIKKED